MKKKPVRKKRMPKTSHDVDTDAARGIFTFTVHGKLHRVDPFEVLMSLRSQEGFDLDSDPQAAYGTDKEGTEAMRRTMDAVAVAFRVKGIHEGGLTVAERMELLLTFCQWCDVQKKSSESSPTTLPTSDAFPGESPAPSNSASTSTKSESSSGEASQPALEPAGS